MIFNTTISSFRFNFRSPYEHCSFHPAALLTSFQYSYTPNVLYKYWISLLNPSYPPFQANVEQAYSSLNALDTKFTFYQVGTHSATAFLKDTSIIGSVNRQRSQHGGESPILSQPPSSRAKSPCRIPGWRDVWHNVPLAASFSHLLVIFFASHIHPSHLFCVRHKC